MRLGAAWARATVPLEYDEQCVVADFLRKSYPCLHWTSTMNGMWTTKGTAVKAQKAGMNPGVPDILIFDHRGPYGGLAIEMKRIRGSVVSPEQIDFIKFFRSIGWRAEICKGAEKAIETIKGYFDLKGDF